jgi:hypothetical protein
VRLSPSTYRRLEALAKRQKRSMSAQVALLVEEWLARQPPLEQHPPLEDDEELTSR